MIIILKANVILHQLDWVNVEVMRVSAPRELRGGASWIRRTRPSK